MGVEVVGSTGRLIMDDVGDGKNPAGEWTGTYKNTGVIWRGDKQVSGQMRSSFERISGYLFDSSTSVLDCCLGLTGGVPCLTRVC